MNLDDAVPIPPRPNNALHQRWEVPGRNRRNMYPITGPSEVTVGVIELRVETDYPLPHSVYQQLADIQNRLAGLANTLREASR